MATDVNRPSPYVCPHCRLGHLKPGTAFYCRWMADTFLTIPDFPAWICDVCGNREYDVSALQDLRSALGGRAEAGFPASPADTEPGSAVGSIGRIGTTE